MFVDAPSRARPTPIRTGWDGEVARRERAGYLDAKRERVDIILPNDHGHAELTLAVQELLDALGLSD